MPIPSVQAVAESLKISLQEAAPDRDQLRRSQYRKNYLLDKSEKLIGLHLGEEVKGKLVLGQAFQDLHLLKIKSSQLTQIVFEVNMPQLDLLDLSECALASLVLPPGFESLKILILPHNQIQTFELQGEEVKSLEVVDLSYNPLSEVYLSSKLPQLGYFYAYGGGLQSFTTEQDLPHLQVLELRKSQLQELHLEHCPRMEWLDLSDLQLREFASDLVYKSGPLHKLPLLKTLILKGNSIRNIPTEIYEKDEQALERVKAYFKDLAEGSTKVFQSKVILIGNGRVGKTCLVKQWLYGTFDAHEPSTHAIQFEIHPLERLAQEEKTDYIQLNIWDFGGQDIYHATHRLFMKTQALFILAWDWVTEYEKPSSDDGTGTENPNRKLGYWLSYADMLGRKGEQKSPVLVVQTKMNKPGHEKSSILQIDELRRRYNISDVLSVDSADGTGFRKFKAALEETITEQIKVTCSKLPESWWKVQQEIQKRQKASLKTLSLKGFDKICKESQVPISSRLILREYLHDTGLFFYQEDLFENQIILDQKWAIDAVYAIFDRGISTPQASDQESKEARKRRKTRKKFQKIVRNDGRFTGEDLEDIWEDYEPKEQELFLSFMESCEICVELKDELGASKPLAEREFLAPALLPNEDIPNREAIFPTGEGLFFRFSHPFLHSAVIERFIVRTARYADPLNIKKNRIFLNRLETGLALVEAFPSKNSILLCVKSNAHVKELLDQIRNELEEIQADMQDIQEWVSLDGDGFVKFAELQETSKNEYIKADNGKELLRANFNIFLGKKEDHKLSEENPKELNQTADMKRKLDLEQKIKESHELLSEWENKQLLSGNPSERKSASLEIEHLKKVIQEYQEEYRDLDKQADPAPPQVEPQAPAEKTKPMKYNLKKILDYINQRYNDEDLSNFCFAYFYEVYNNFGDTQNKGTKLRNLLDHCQRQEEMPDLLDNLKEDKPEIYAKYQDTFFKS